MTDLAPLPAPEPLVVRTLAVDDPGDLLALLPAASPRAALAWVRRGEGIVGWGEAARIDTAGPKRILAAEAWLARLARRAIVRDEVDAAGSGLVAFGSFAFSPDSARGGSLVVPRVVLGRRAGRAWLTTVGTAAQLEPIPSPAALRLGAAPVAGPGLVSLRDGSLTAQDWQERVADVVARIRDGEAAKVVLARAVDAICAQDLDARWLLGRLAAAYPTCWTFAVDGLVGATPELLVRREAGLATSRVLAGTIQRTGDDEHDLARAAALARSSKDLEEHELAVASAAAALAPFASAANVPETPSVLHLPNVMHLATDISAALDDDATTSLRLADALHPTAAVCGTPTQVAARMVAEVEGMDRGRYAGPVGWTSADGDGEWGIGLRSAEVDPGDARRLRLFAGCGVVAASDPAAELAESEAKLEPMRHALMG